MQKGVIVTGGAHGIGKQICLDFLSAGYNVCFMDIDEKLSSEFANEHSNLFYYCGDVANKNSLKEFVEFSMKKLNNPGFTGKAPQHVVENVRNTAQKMKEKIEVINATIESLK